MFKAKEFTELTGVNVRTLHYYDEIDLLKPCVIDERTGYRFYDNESILRMQEILFFKEVGVPLKQIRTIINSQDYDRKQALEEHRKLLILKRNRLDKLISSIDDAIKGRNIMCNFEDKEFRLYKKSLKERWGKNIKAEDCDFVQQEIDVLEPYMGILVAEFNLYMLADFSADSLITQEMVRKLKREITIHDHTCTNELLKDFANKCKCNEIYKKSIDKYGEGTAEYISTAITIFCDNN